MLAFHSFADLFLILCASRRGRDDDLLSGHLYFDSHFFTEQHIHHVDHCCSDNDERAGNIKLRR